MMTLPFHHISKKNIARADGTVRGGFRVAAILLLLPIHVDGTSNADPSHSKIIRGGGKDGDVVGNLIAGSGSNSTAPTEDPCSDKTTVRVNVTTDRWRYDTSWSLMDKCTGLLLASMPRDDIEQYPEKYTEYSNSF